ncbi:hypothetical protein [Phytoactinopolyspora mesophila]|uniref:Uncharacterized protein n=1 Tax=Phytoactinopolyspora mesophila TaxID=2650750 RepID=A0A7K3M6H0_9ACTN|nr:hypothetical protein [Phytoactinopolyspora mesophila]NDL58018.1 hypothetical protein [Phytoactinopolyspora mesophila]
MNVWGSGTTAGEDGYEIPGNTVWSRPPCYYFELPHSGAEAYAQRSSFTGGPTGGGKWTLEMLEEYKDEDEGNWWDTGCAGVSLDEAIEFTENNPVTYVFPGDPIPVPDIPPEFLLEAAHDALELPAPEVSWNPQRQGDGATLVNMPTWFWLDDGPVDLEVHAEAAGNRATVDAVLSEMGFSAATAESVVCDGFGIAWAPGATSDCFLEFRRSSANQPGQTTRVQAQSHWSVEWFFNDELQGPLDPQTTQQEFLVPVAEVQARVTG